MLVTLVVVLEVVSHRHADHRGDDDTRQLDALLPRVHQRDGGGDRHRHGERPRNSGRGNVWGKNDVFTIREKKKLSTSSIQRISTRAGVNSAPELELIANSNSNSGIGIELELPSLELNWNCHHWN